MGDTVLWNGQLAEGIGNVFVSDSGHISDVVMGSITLEALKCYEIIDCTGCYILPAGIDSHVHLSGMSGERLMKETRGAIEGGTTTVLDFVQGNKTCLGLEDFESRKEHMKAGYLDFSFHYTYTENYTNELAEDDEILKKGLASYKIYTCYDGVTLSYEDMEKLFAACPKDRTFLIHCEDLATMENNLKGITPSERKKVFSHELIRSKSAELTAVKTIVELAKKYGTSICIAHVSSKDTADYIREEKKRYSKLYMESCPQYLFLNQELFQKDDGALYVCAPPIRTDDDIKGIWEAMSDGTVDIISSDHCPFPQQKKLQFTDVTTIPCGLGGIQQRYIYLFSECVIKRGMTIKSFIELASENAAKMYGIFPRKGAIEPGSDADIVVVNPNEKWTFHKSDIATGEDYSVYDGLEICGKIKYVLKGGLTYIKDSEWQDLKPAGEFIKAIR